MKQAGDAEALDHGFLDLDGTVGDHAELQAASAQFGEYGHDFCEASTS
jgi:hypothetical protein